MTDKIKGIVKKFNDAKGYGFISLDNEEKNVFAHATQLDNVGGYLKGCETFLFNPKESQKGLETINITKIECTA